MSETSQRSTQVELSPLALLKTVRRGQDALSLAMRGQRPSRRVSAQFHGYLFKRICEFLGETPYSVSKMVGNTSYPAECYRWGKSLTIGAAALSRMIFLILLRIDDPAFDFRHIPVGDESNKDFWLAIEVRE